MNKGLITKMIVVGLLGITLIAVVVGLLLTPKDTKTQKDTTSAVDTTEEAVVDESTTDTSKDLDRILALVKAIDLNNNLMTVYDIDHDLTINMVLNGTVLFEDEYGSIMVAEQMLPGYLVNIKYDKNNYVPEQVKVAPQIQTIKNLSSFVLDEEQKTIQIGSDIYNYTDEIITSDGDQKLDLAGITIADDVVVRAYKDTIWSIIIENGHGYIILQNYDAYLDGTIEIGNRTSYTVVPEMRIPVTVGVQNVIITKDTMTPYSASVLIVENEDYVIDLSEYQPKISEVTFRIIQEGATLFINDTISPYDAPVILDYGQYDIKVKLDGYKDWQGIVVIDQPSMDQIIDMETEPMYLRMKGPDGATLYIDSVKIGVISNNEIIETPITPGDHVLLLVKSGYLQWTDNVHIEESGEDIYYTIESLTPINDGSTNTDNTGTDTTNTTDGTTPDTTPDATTNP